MKHPHTPENRLRTHTVSRMCAVLANMVLANMVLVGSVVLTCVSTWGLTACASSQGSSTAAGAAASSAAKESAPQNAKALVLGETSWDEWKRKAGPSLAWGQTGGEKGGLAAAMRMMWPLGTATRQVRALRASNKEGIPIKARVGATNQRSVQQKQWETQIPSWR